MGAWLSYSAIMALTFFGVWYVGMVGKAIVDTVVFPELYPKDTEKDIHTVGFKRPFKYGD